MLWFKLRPFCLFEYYDTEFVLFHSHRKTQKVEEIRICCLTLRSKKCLVLKIGISSPSAVIFKQCRRHPQPGFQHLKYFNLPRQRRNIRNSCFDNQPHKKVKGHCFKIHEMLYQLKISHLFIAVNKIPEKLFSTHSQLTLLPKKYIQKTVKKKCQFSNDE